MEKDGKCVSTFEMICASIIYSVRIIIIANMKGGFMISDTLRSLNTSQIIKDIIITSDRNIYVYYKEM